MRDSLMERFVDALQRAGTDADLIEVLIGPGYAEECSEDELLELIDQFEAVSQSAVKLDEALPLLVFDYRHRQEMERTVQSRREDPPETRGPGTLARSQGTSLLGPAVPIRPLRLEGTRVVLREMVEEDAEGVFAYASDPEVTQHLAWGPTEELEASRDYIRECRAENHAGLALTLGVEWKAERAVVGAVALFNLAHAHNVGEIGFVLQRRVWGRGIGHEMLSLMLHYGFTAMHLERIEGWAVAENARSRHLLEKVGMTREGLLRGHRVYRGVPVDRVVYGLLRSDWERLALSQ